MYVPYALRAQLRGGFSVVIVRSDFVKWLSSLWSFRAHCAAVARLLAAAAAAANSFVVTEGASDF